MGRYRRGHKYRKWRGRNRKQNQSGAADGEPASYSQSQMADADWISMEKYLMEYRSKAYEAYHLKRRNSNYHQDKHQQQLSGTSVLIGNHIFEQLTMELCNRPYIDLPDSLNGKERRKIHSLCSSLDLYHAGAGGDYKKNSNFHIKEEASATNDSTDTTGTSEAQLKRRISISIYADGLDRVPDLESLHGTNSLHQLPSRTCQPWYYRAYAKSTINELDDGKDDRGNPYKKRIQAIQLEEKEICKLANFPEQCLRRSDGVDQSFSDFLDFGILNSLDLSQVPAPEETPWMLVDTVDKLKFCVNELLHAFDSNGNRGARSPKLHELAFDLEMDNMGEGNIHCQSKSGMRTCLIQLTSNVSECVYDERSGTSKEVCKDYVIDPLAPGIWDAIPTLLGPLFSNPNFVKVGHGIGGMDISSLHRDFGILVVNAFDTYEASVILSPGKGGMGLASLCRHYGLPSWEYYKELKNKYQCSDWRKRPLDDASLLYGRYDIRYLITLRKLLMRDLAKLDMLPDGHLALRSSLEDESILSPPSTHVSKEKAHCLHSFGSKFGNLISSTESTSSKNEFNDAVVSNNLLDQLKVTHDHTAKSIMAQDGSEALMIDTSDSRCALSLPSSSTKLVIHASELPCYQQLMKAISISQKRCLKLWDGDEEEPILKNPSLLIMIKQAAMGKGQGKYWSDTHMQLYKQLTKWRADTAYRELSSVAEVCSLDFLVHVAYKMPKNKHEMRRYAYTLPVLLEDTRLTYCDELLGLVASFQCHDSPPLSESKSMDVVFYSDHDTGGIVERHKQKKLFNFLIASTFIGTIFFTMTRARRR